MKTFNQSQNTHPVVYAIKMLIHKLWQQPNVYPIKYYKKGKRFAEIRNKKLYKKRDAFGIYVKHNSAKSLL